MSSLVLVVYHCKWRVWQKEWPSYSIFCSLVTSPGIHDVNELAIRQRGEQSKSRVRNNTFSHLSGGGDEHLSMGGSLVSSTVAYKHLSLLLHLRLHSSLIHLNTPMRHILKLKLSIFQEMSEKLKLTFLQGFQDDCCRFSHVQIVSILGSSV